MINTIIKIIACHLIGDYVLQTDFLAKTKGKNWYHLFAHCFLYCVPFIILWGIDWRFYVLLVSHFIVDAMKARYNKISYVFDQLYHYIIAFGLYLMITM